MGTTSTYDTASTRRGKTTMPISHLHEQLPAQALGTIASLSTHPLVSVAAAAYVLALLYLPSNFLSLLLSPPVSLTTLLLLVALLHLGSSSPAHPQQREDNDQLRLPPPCPPYAAEPATAVPKAPTSALLGFQQKPVFSPERYQFVEYWARRGPLEVIYELEYEGEVDDEDLDEDSSACSRSRRRRLGLPEGIDSLVICCYTDDSDDEESGSDSLAWDSQEDPCFMWEEDDEGLIEIALDEDNLIEIDISACR